MSLKASRSFFPLTWQLRSLHLKIKRQYQRFHFSDIIILHNKSMPYLLYKPISPNNQSWVSSNELGASCPCYKSTGFTLVLTIHKPLILKKKKKKKCCWIFNICPNIYQVVFKHRQERTSQSLQEDEA